MNELTWTPELELEDTPRVVALGAFDGVHLGHQSTITRVRRLARERNAESTVLTFDPSPREFVDGVRQTGRRLTTRPEQMCRLREIGVDTTVVIEFPGQIRTIEPEDFVRDVLVGQLRATCVCASESHRFGRNGAGDLSLLQKLAERYGFEVVVVTPVDIHDHRISSTLIRELLSHGNVNRAGALLGRPYSIVADVVSGQGLGTGLGFPTANLRIPSEKLVPHHGVYAGVAGKATGECQVIEQPRPAAINVGTAPTVGRHSRVVEVHLVGVQCDLTGAAINVQFLRWLRPEQAFADRGALIEQITRDVAECGTVSCEVMEACAAGHHAEQPRSIVDKAHRFAYTSSSRSVHRPHQAGPGGFCISGAGPWCGEQAPTASHAIGAYSVVCTRSGGSTRCLRR